MSLLIIKKPATNMQPAFLYLKEKIIPVKQARNATFRSFVFFQDKVHRVQSHILHWKP